MDTHEKVERERVRFVVQLDRILDTPMMILGVIWLILLVVELVGNATPAMERWAVVLWCAFIAEFVIKFAVAPRKLLYLRRNWLGLLSLLVPAFRLFRAVRIARLARLARSTRLVRILGTVNRNMRALRMTLRRRQFGYVLALFALVDVVGAAGMYAFERGVAGTVIHDYATALWWTTMLLTTFGTDYWPKTGEGRALSALLAFFAVGTLGYITAALASFFVGSDASRRSSSP